MPENNGTSSSVLCFFCTSTTHILECQKCQRPYCPEHTSPLDTSLCSECVKLVDTSIRKEDLIDDEGKRHEGRRMLLTGEAWMRSRELIANLTNIELEAKIKAYQEAVHEAELILDYRRIMLGQAQHEKSERFGRSAKRLRLIKDIDKVHHVVAGNSIEQKKQNIEDAMKAVKKLGIPKDKIAELLLKLTKK